MNDPVVIVEYDRRGIAVSDFELEEYFLRLFSTRGIAQVSTENLFYYIKREVALGNYPSTYFAFKFEGQLVRLNEYGMTTDAPPSFLGVISALCEQTIVAAIKRRKEKRGER